MTVFICLDDKNGLLFNKRRQSKDSVLRKRVYELTKDSKLYMNEFTYRQFEEDNFDNVVVVDDPLKAGCEYAFIEDIELNDKLDLIDKLIIFKWNRAYPSTVKFTASLDSYVLENTYEFAGSSHDNITEETYIKR